MTTGTELTFDDVLASVRGLRGRPVRLVISRAGDPPRTLATITGVIGGQQKGDEHEPRATITRVRWNQATVGTFTLDPDRFSAAAWGENALMIRHTTGC